MSPSDLRDGHAGERSSWTDGLADAGTSFYAIRITCVGRAVCTATIAEKRSRTMPTFALTAAAASAPWPVAASSCARGAESQDCRRVRGFCRVLRSRRHHRACGLADRRPVRWRRRTGLHHCVDRDAGGAGIRTGCSARDQRPAVPGVVTTRVARRCRTRVVRPRSTECTEGLRISRRSRILRGFHAYRRPVGPCADAGLD